MAVRALGADVVSVSTIDQMDGLKLGRISCIISTETEVEAYRATLAARHLAIVVGPNAISTEIDSATLSETAADRRPFGLQILFTTGTTGSSKKVLMRGDEEDARNKLRSATFSFDRRSVIYTGLDLHTGAGFKSPSAVWSEGGLVILDGSSDVAPAMRTYRITSILTSPRLASGACFEKRSCRRLCAIASI